MTDEEKTDYIFAGGITIARVKNGVTTYLPNNDSRDHLGSPVRGTASNGNILFTELYTPFGIPYYDSEVNQDQAGYTGHIRDGATDLNYMQARYYDPVIGRFLSVDPVTFMDTGDTAQFNRYTYGNNDPINKIDPDGADAIDIQFVDQVIRPTGKKWAVPQSISGGHSGVIAISPTGLTRYREFGRYTGSSVRDDQDGGISDIVYGKNNVPTKESLRNVLLDALAIGERAGSSKLEVTIDLKADDFDAMIKEVGRWKTDVGYSWKTRKTCHDFCTAVRRKGGGGGFRTSRQVFKSDLTSETLDDTVDKLHKKWESVVD